MANKVMGQNVCLFVSSGSTSGTTAQVLALATSCKISITLATINTANKDDGDFESVLPTRFSWTIDGDGFYSVDADAARFTFDELMAMYLAKTPIGVAIGSTTGVMPQVVGTGKVLSGQAYITKLDIDAKDANAVTYTISLQGTGALAYGVVA